MDQKKFLFVSNDALIGDTAWKVIQEGHYVRYFIKNPEEKDVADGFVPKSDDWEKDVEWADIIIFDDVVFGNKAKKLRDQGKLVVGGSPYTDKLEDDRSFGQDELKKAGVNTLPYNNFTSFDDAIEFVTRNPGRYVIKPSGQIQTNKGLLFVGEEEDGKDVIKVLDDYKRAWSKKMHSFQLQKRINGVEAAVGAFFNGKEFVYPININFEHKKLFPGNIGPSTGEMGCYDENTEVLTEKGWKYFKGLDHNDKICTLNPDNDNIEFNKPELIVAFSHHKELIKIKNEDLDIAVTPDHNMFVSSNFDAKEKNNSFEFVKARDLQHQSLIKRTGIWRSNTIKSFLLKPVLSGSYQNDYQKNQLLISDSYEIKVDMDDWLPFFGMWLSNGHVSGSKICIDKIDITDTGIYRINGEKQIEKQMMLKHILDKIPFNFRENNSEYYTYNKQLASYLDEFKEESKKYIPGIIKDLAPTQINLFLDWYCLCNGKIIGEDYRVFYTYSKELANDIQELALKTGRVAVIKKVTGKKAFLENNLAHRPKLQYEIHERTKNLDVIADGKEIKKIRYNKKVYCATVKNHIMYVRRNGKPYWCGNTSMFWSGPNKLFNNTLKKIEPKLAEEGYIGYIDINCMVNSNGIYPLEFTSRFGYPTISIQQEGMISHISEFLYELAQGKKPKLNVRNGFQVGVAIVVPPFPFKDIETLTAKSKESVILFKKPNLEGVHIEDIKKINDEWVVAGTSGFLLTVCGTGPTMKQAQNQAYHRVKNILIPNMYYRTDIGDRWYEDSDRLHTWGYLREG